MALGEVAAEPSQLRELGLVLDALGDRVERERAREEPIEVAEVPPRRERWLLAGVCCAAAGLVRSTGAALLLAVGLALTSLRPRLARLRRSTLVYSGVLAAIVLVGILDQTSSRDAPRYDVLRAEYASDEAFVRGDLDTGFVARLMAEEGKG